jgi:tetratricopeptide (TPR) repeat protein
MNSTRIGFVFVLLIVASATRADVTSLAQAWDEITYRGDPAARENALEALAERAHAESSAAPDDTGLLIWYGIAESSYAGARGGLSALSLAREARAAFELAITRDPTALDGSAYTSLGTLYYKVPGWPIGFGSDKKARDCLAQALRINPTGIDQNYFMAEFLVGAGEYADAKSYLATALQAPARPNRTIGDAGRRDEARALLVKVNQKLGASN